MLVAPHIDEVKQHFVAVAEYTFYKSCASQVEIRDLSFEAPSGQGSAPRTPKSG